MAKMGQDEKEFLNLAGEFHVAGELSRERIRATLTYGNSKRADVIAFSTCGTEYARIEVKTSESMDIIVGNKAIMESEVRKNLFWVLVFLPEKGLSPKYFVFHSRDLHRIAKARFDLYNSRYKGKHGADFVKPGVHKVRVSEIQQFENKWSSIRDFLESSANPKSKEY